MPESSVKANQRFCAEKTIEDLVRTVLIGWELGAGRGHAERLVPIVEAYRTNGWKVVAALRDARLGADVLGPHQSAIRNGHLTIIRAPIFSHTEIERGPVNSLAEILAKTGFSKPGLVRPLVAGWDAILARYRPNVVVSDSAPSLNIVARGRVPLIVIGNGWTIPPDITPPPALIAAPEGSQSLRDAADAVLSAMRTAVSNDTGISRFSDLLRGDHNIVCSLDETDPYHRQRTDRLHWPFEIGAPAVVPPQERSGGLIYLPKNHPARPLMVIGPHRVVRFDC
jgi:rhamnosyltransferase subunit B